LLYWPEFEFDFRLDVPGLLPHIAAIEACQEAASNRVLPPPWREQTAATAEDAGEQKAGEEPIVARKRELLLTNASAARTWIKERCHPGRLPLSLADILHMHQLVAEESGVHSKNGGVWRTSGVQVGRREVGGLHAGAPPERVPALMNGYVRLINGDDLRSFPPAIHALVAHFFFTTIHPFDDGNGRVSRLVAAGILFQRGYNGHGFHALSNYFYQNDIQYHTLLHQCWQQPLPFDLTSFVAFGMQGLVTELQGINSFVRVKLHRTPERISAC